MLMCDRRQELSLHSEDLIVSMPIEVLSKHSTYEVFFGDMPLVVPWRHSPEGNGDVYLFSLTLRVWSALTSWPLYGGGACSECL